MATHLSMANIQAIAALHCSGHSNRQIVGILGINRETVGKYGAELKKHTAQNQLNPQTGFSRENRLIVNHNPSQKWLVLTRKRVAGSDPQTDTLDRSQTDADPCVSNSVRSIAGGESVVGGSVPERRWKSGHTSSENFSSPKVIVSLTFRFPLTICAEFKT